MYNNKPKVGHKGSENKDIMPSSGYQDGPVREELLTRLRCALNIAHVEGDTGNPSPLCEEEQHILVTNESHLHNVPANSELHFNLTVASNIFTLPDFASRLARHRFAYNALGDMIHSVNGAHPKIHMLKMNLFTLDEWHERGGAVEKSPPCLGGLAHH